MRLKSIELYDKFRSLKSGFRLDFIKEPPKDKIAIEPYCVVGRNGSGKSNILELLSAIFYQVEIKYLSFLPKEIDPPFVNNKQEQYISNDTGQYVDNREYKELEIFQSFDTNPNAYKLEYYFTYEDRQRLVTIEKREKEDINIYLDDDLENSLSAIEAKEVLPACIVGYSSGQNEILNLPFYKMRLIQHDEYIDYLSKEIQFKTHESRMVYLDDTFSQAIFATNFIFGDTLINEVFSQTIGVEALESFRIVIKTNLLVEDIVIESENGLEEQERLLLKEFAYKVELLKSCATMSYEDKENDELILDYYLDKQGVMKEMFKKQFALNDEKTGKDISYFNLFQTFQTLINLNYYHIDPKTKKKLYESKSLFAKGYLPQASWNKRFFTFKNFMLKKKGIEEPVYSKSLSDGEYQFLHSIGLALIYRDTQSLFLLDEPETHFNPSWRAEYMSVLKECFDKSEAKAEFLITSHSPFIVSDTKEEKVLFFKKDKEGNVQRKHLSFNTFGASVDKITSKVFGQKNSMGDRSLEILEEYRDKIDNSADLKALVKDIEGELGESIEKFLLLKNIFDRMKKDQ